MAGLTGLNIRGGVTGNMLPFDITFSPTVAILAGRIDKLGLDIRSFKAPLTKSVKDVMTKSITNNFNSSGRPAWEPLAQSSLDTRRSFGNPNSDPLIWTGNLRRVAGQMNIWTITSNSAIIRDLPQKAWYGVIHQAGYGGSGGSSATAAPKANLGTKGKGGRYKRGLGTGAGRVVGAIPARPFAVLQPEDEEAIADIFENWLAVRVAVAGLG